MTSLTNLWKPKKGPPMTLSVNAIIQSLSFVAQFANQLSDVVPPDGKPWIMGGLLILQGVTAILAQFKNPDGTPASQPYIAVPPPK